MGESIFMTVLRKRMDTQSLTISEEDVKQKVTRLMNYASDCQHLRDVTANRKPRAIHASMPVGYAAVAAVRKAPSEFVPVKEKS